VTGSYLAATSFVAGPHPAQLAIAALAGLDAPVGLAVRSMDVAKP
jgi:hypothetical protein